MQKRESYREQGAERDDPSLTSFRRRIAALEKSWAEKARTAAFYPFLTWTAEGPRLGAATTLVRGAKGEEAQLLALLSVAYGFTVQAKVLGHLAWAEREFQRGDITKSAMHVALTGLPALAAREGARRLHIAAGILDDGFLTPTALLKACGLDSGEVETLAKYYEDQPRVPAGNPEGGEWTRDGAPASGDKPARRKTGSHDDVALVLPDGCDEEWKNAIDFCLKLFRSPNPPRSLTGGYKTPEACAKGFVSQRCGGNRV